MIDPVNIGGVLDPRVRRGALGRGGDQIFADRADEWRKLNRQSNSAQNGAHDARARVMTILGYAIDSIRGKLSALRELGFSDPAKIITSLPAILGYAPERLHLAPGMRTSAIGLMPSSGALISKRRVLIEAVASQSQA